MKTLKSNNKKQPSPLPDTPQSATASTDRGRLVMVLGLRNPVNKNEDSGREKN